MAFETRNIYVRYLDGCEGLLGVKSRRLASGYYEILPYQEFDYEDDSILFEFGPGDIVEATEELLPNGVVQPLASRLVREDSQNIIKRMLFSIFRKNPSPSDLVAEFGTERVKNMTSEVTKMRWVYPAILEWLNTNTEALQQMGR